MQFLLSYIRCCLIIDHYKLRQKIHYYGSAIGAIIVRKHTHTHKITNKILHMIDNVWLDWQQSRSGMVIWSMSKKTTPGGCCAQQPSWAPEKKATFLPSTGRAIPWEEAMLRMNISRHFLWCEFCAKQDILPDIWTLSLMSLFYLSMDYYAME